VLLNKEADRTFSAQTP